MTKTASRPSAAKITLSASQDIPFNKLVLSQANVRHVNAGVSIEQLAEDIALRTLLQSLTVRPILDTDGVETGMYEVPVGGRRYRALELLIKQKRLAKTTLVPCVIRTDGLAAEDSLAENVQRAPLHPLDQFRAFQTLQESGLSEEDIAARFFVNPSVVKQRLRLVTVSPKLLDIYAEDGMTLEQLMAFSVTTNHDRQEQVWEGLAHAFNKEPYYIRRLLTEEAVHASDKRALFIGLDVYVAAGGAVMRDLFQNDEGGWLQDPVLLDRLVVETIETEVEILRAEGWKWIETALDFPYGHTQGLRRLSGVVTPLTDEEQASQDALQTEYNLIEENYGGSEDMPEDIAQRLAQLEAALVAFEDRPVTYDPADIARAGAFVSVDSAGVLRIERGFVRPEDEPVVQVPDTDQDGSVRTAEPAVAAAITVPQVTGAVPPDEEEGLKPLPDRLITELTVHRTLALRDALAGDPDTAFLAVLHNFCLKTFYHYADESCLEIDVKSVAFITQAPGLADSLSAKAIDARHQNWRQQLPEDPAQLWDVLVGFDADSKVTLFAHCAALTVNAVVEPWNRRPGRLAHVDHIAHRVGLDMVAAGWTPTVDNYLGRVTKARILETVREAKGDEAALRIDHLKKPDMAKEAETLLQGSGWLPEILRMPNSHPETTDQPEILIQAAE